MQFNLTAQFKWVFCANTTHVKRLYGNSTARNGTDDLRLDVILLCRNMADDSKFFLLCCFALIFSYEARKCLNMIPLSSAH